MIPALAIAHLTKRYPGGTTAVDDLSLEIAAGEFFGFLGPNGAGKSTTIHCITGIAKITAGSIHLFGIDATAQYREARRRVGFAPQEFNIDIFAKVTQLLDYNAGYFGLRAAERTGRIEMLLGQFGLREHAHKTFQELSGGLKRRVMLARAMVHDPDLLILDEPTAGVDVEMRRDLWRFLRELHGQGKTIMLTSHYLDEVEKLCDRIAVINEGKVIACAPKGEFIKDGSTLEETYVSLTKKSSV